MADLFKQVIPSILKTKKNVLLDEVDTKEYKKQAFTVNRALSYHVDCILYANLRVVDASSYLNGSTMPDEV